MQRLFLYVSPFAQELQPITLTAVTCFATALWSRYHDAAGFAPQQKKGSTVMTQGCPHLPRSHKVLVPILLRSCLTFCSQNQAIPADSQLGRAPFILLMMQRAQVFQHPTPSTQSARKVLWAAGAGLCDASRFAGLESGYAGSEGAGSSFQGKIHVHVNKEGNNYEWLINWAEVKSESRSKTERQKEKRGAWVFL